jgi:hypothetical protein
MSTTLAPNGHLYKHHAPLSHQMLTVSHYYHDMGTRGGGWLLVLLLVLVLVLVLVPIPMPILVLVQAQVLWMS